MSQDLKKKRQKNAYISPWSVRERAAFALWRAVWLVAYRPTPKFMNRWRLFVLRCFGCKMEGKPFVSSSSEVRIPWHLSLRHRACLGESVVIYNLDHVTVGERATIAQQSYLCCGTHDLTDPNLPLVTGPIIIHEDVFVGARAFIMPGVTLGRSAVVGACAVVVKDVCEGEIVAGNPAKRIRMR